MKLTAFRSISSIALALSLAACGSGTQVDSAPQTAGVMTSSAARTAAVPAVASNTMPAPDCAADGCKGLRIIDANAEAYRYEAMRRAAAEEAAGTTQS